MQAASAQVRARRYSKRGHVHFIALGRGDEDHSGGTADGSLGLALDRAQPLARLGRVHHLSSLAVNSCTPRVLPSR